MVVREVLLWNKFGIAVCGNYQKTAGDGRGDFVVSELVRHGRCEVATCGCAADDETFAQVGVEG